MSHKYVNFIAKMLTDDPDILEVPVYEVNVSNGMPSVPEEKKAIKEPGALRKRLGVLEGNKSKLGNKKK
jgi:hypothetical protein